MFRVAALRVTLSVFEARLILLAVEPWRGKQLFLANEERDQQRSHAALPVDEGVYRFGLVVHDPETDERRQVAGRVEVVLNGVERLEHIVNWGRDELGLVQRASGGLIRFRDLRNSTGVT